MDTIILIDLSSYPSRSIANVFTIVNIIYIWFGVFWQVEVVDLSIYGVSWVVIIGYALGYMVIFGGIISLFRLALNKMSFDR